MTGMKRHAPAALRNREPIVAVLSEILPPTGLALEIASGSGEHVVHFAAAFPRLAWQPSDPDPDALGSIAAWADESEAPNILEPIALDAAATEWPISCADALLCINMVHISPWAATKGLIAGAARVLVAGAPLYLYGPYLREGVETVPSNLAFDKSLKARNPDWGLRRLEDVVAVAEANGFALERVVDMPANNLSVIFRRQ